MRPNMSTRCRRRGPRMTTSHKTVFVNWLKSHPDNIRVLRVGPPSEKSWRSRKWREIATTLNRCATTYDDNCTPPKSVDKWKKSISDMMSKLKKKQRFEEKFEGLESVIMKLYMAPLPDFEEKLEDMSSDECKMNDESSDEYCSEINKVTQTNDILYLTEPEVTDKLECYSTEANQDPVPEPIDKKESNSEMLLNNANRQTAAMESIAKSLVVLTERSEQTNKIMVKCVETLSALVEVLTNKNKL